jgi:hypothetical protein
MWWPRSTRSGNAGWETYLRELQSDNYTEQIREQRLLAVPGR